MEIGAGRGRASAVEQKSTPEQPPQSTDRFLSTARRLAAECFGPPAERSFAIRYWSGFIELPPGRPAFTILVNTPGALRTALLPPSELGFGEAFVRGELALDGDLETAVGAVRGLGARLSAPLRIARMVRLALRLPAPGAAGGLRRWRPARRLRRHERARDAAAVRHHYDVGNDFYRLWLDAQWVYSCAYFEPGVRNLDMAQEAKLDYICRKLELTPGERFLDVGCGWGGLIRHAARRYGADAVGITLSPSQADVARRRIVDDDLADSCRVELLDYRDLPPTPAYHKVASVGMVEHVGRARLADYFEAVFRSLRPGGAFLYHGIVDLIGARRVSAATRLRRRLWREGRFLHCYVFPDGELPRLAEVVRAAERAGFETRDVESLREHYVQTLRHWVRRLDARRREAAALVGDATLRVWQLYLAASAHAFASGRIGVVQILFFRPHPDHPSEVPRTRHRLYPHTA